MMGTRGMISNKFLHIKKPHIKKLTNIEMFARKITQMRRKTKWKNFNNFSMENTVIKGLIRVIKNTVIKGFLYLRNQL